MYEETVGPVPIGTQCWSKVLTHLRTKLRPAFQGNTCNFRFAPSSDVCVNASARSSGVCNGVGDYGQFKRKRSLTSRNEEGLHLGFNIPKALQNTCSGNDVNYESLVKRSETPAAVKAVAENADSNTTSALESRQYIDRVTINLWEHINYTGRFIRLPAAWSICYTITTFAFDSRDENWASSARADPGTKCVLYDNNACRGDSVELTQLGSPDLRVGSFNDRLSSYRCGPA